MALRLFTVALDADQLADLDGADPGPLAAVMAELATQVAAQHRATATAVTARGYSAVVVARDTDGHGEQYWTARARFARGDVPGGVGVASTMAGAVEDLAANLGRIAAGEEA